MFWRWEGLNNILYDYTLKANFRGLEVHAVMTIMNIWPAAHLLLCIKNNPFTDNSRGIATRRVKRSELRPAVKGASSCQISACSLQAYTY